MGPIKLSELLNERYGHTSAQACKSTSRRLRWREHQEESVNPLFESRQKSWAGVSLSTRTKGIRHRGQSQEMLDEAVLTDRSRGVICRSFRDRSINSERRKLARTPK